MNGSAAPIQIRLFSFLTSIEMCSKPFFFKGQDLMLGSSLPGECFARTLWEIYQLHCQYNRAALAFRHQAVIEAQTWELALGPKP